MSPSDRDLLSFPSLLPAAYTSLLARHRPCLALGGWQCFAADDAVAREAIQLGFGKTQQAAQDFIVVLAERGCRRPHCDGRVFVAIRRRGLRMTADIGAFDPLPETARLEVGIVQQIHGMADGAGSHTCLL